MLQDGQNCTMAINKSKCSYCDYHVQGELRRMSTARATLRANNLRTAFRGSSAAKRPGRPNAHLAVHVHRHAFRIISRRNTLRGQLTSLSPQRVKSMSACAGAKQGHVSKLSHQRLQAHTMEQLRQVAQAHPHTSSLGKKYVI